MDLITQKPLPDVPLTDPVILQIHAFDDILRAQVGDVIVETPRGAQREGRVCLMSQGEARFESLHVEGLDMFLFPFATSRFRSFQEHIATFTGAVDALGPNVLGAGTSPSTPATLFDSSEIIAAMKPDAPPEQRQALFEKWMTGAGVPIKADVSKVELSSYRIGAQSWFLLLETAEPLDFTEEITCALTRGEWVASTTTIGVAPGEIVRPGVDRPRRAVGGASSATVRAARDALRERVFARESAVTGAVATIEPGAVLVTELAPLTPVAPTGSVDWKPVDVLVLQDASAKRAMLFPLASGTIAAMPPGSYRLGLTLGRLRWRAINPPDKLNRYDGAGTMAFQL